MAASKSKSQGALHPNPKIARALADHDSAPGKFSSAAELCRAHNINDKATQRQVRQILRDAGQGVGRGRRYADITHSKVERAAKANANRKTKGTKAAPKAAKSESAPKETASAE